MPDVTTAAGRDELRLRIVRAIGTSAQYAAFLDDHISPAMLFSLLDQADAADRHRADAERLRAHLRAALSRCGDCDGTCRVMKCQRDEYGNEYPVGSVDCLECIAARAALEPRP